VISCNTVTASSDTLGVHSHAADEGGQLAWSALAHPRLSSRARTDPRPQLQLFHARSVIQHATNSSRSAKPGLLLSASFRCVSAMGRCVVVPCAGERLDRGFYVRGALGAVSSMSTVPRVRRRRRGPRRRPVCVPLDETSNPADVATELSRGPTRLCLQDLYQLAVRGLGTSWGPHAMRVVELRPRSAFLANGIERV
jgi:hypothetical protein